MRVNRLIRWAAAGVAIAACSSTSAPVPDTGLTGTVTRGPVTPVCMPAIPCNAPFAATFTVRSGTRTLATFRSDSLGNFTVHVAPGDYLIVPNADAPVMPQQSQAVTVGATGLTSVQLSFDTGLR